MAGLIAGFRLLEKGSKGEEQLPPRQTIGLMVSPKKEHEQRVLEIARIAGGHIGLDPESDLTLSDIRLDPRFYGPGYGILDTATERSLREIATKEGVLMDPVYSGKAARGMISSIRSGELNLDARKRGHTGERPLNILMLHTGGQTVYSAYA
ncbi:1-aminocyclopropane-1-carboxylate deaminase [Aspergillus affinis]|uniref:1-aminocyclopropane-1-carboxylate deaminase n=1 Tax=Aspergillus affinis TaxID=1070780 RepID=UPI0022FDC684|nr:1-aminocyclopropane-1-carboxylate deaminase [Aspergillus affinis]KAI9045462.1 1-aminocyclopropane-1-carboxylate deaminase [Aspergillus affinis]